MLRSLKEAKFVSSATNVKQLGISYAEVAFVGRSNVGKSSLLNALCFQKGLAKTSKTPGRTRLINVFAVSIDRWIIDLPGYGFALCPVKERESWHNMVEGYLVNRESLSMVYLLLDAEVGPTDLDGQMISWLAANDLPYRIVATKCDKVRASKQLTRRQKIAADLGVHYLDVAWVSSSIGTGVPNLRIEVLKMLA
jgi:GTP-binding protein